MRVWLLTSELPRDVAGGIATYVDAFARLLGGAGHDVTVFAQSRDAVDERIAAGVRVIGFPAPAQPTLPAPAALGFALAERVLALAASGGPPDVIESQEYLGLPYFLLQRRLTERGPLARTPIVVHLHSPDFEIARVNETARFRFARWWPGEMEKFSIVAADALVSPSAFLAERVRAVLRRPLEIACLRYPLVLPAPARPAAPRRGDVLYVGRLEVRKGVPPLVHACAGLWEAGEDFRLTLVGGDDVLATEGTTVEAFLRREYARWIAAGRLRLLGRLERPRLLELLAEAWAVVVPSVWDNFPNVCMEAMALGQLVLASRAGGQAEMLGTDGGLLFDWQTAGDFERQLRRVLGLADAERRGFGERARGRIDELCRPETVLDQRLRHFAATIAHHREPASFPSPSVPPVASAPTADAETGLLSIVVSTPEHARAAAAATYAPCEVVRTEAPGRLDARRLEAGAARGEFVTFLDAGGTVDPGFYANAVDVLRRYPNVAFVYSWVRDLGEAGVVHPSWNAELPYLLAQDPVPPFFVARRAAYLRAAAGAVGDHDTWIALVCAGGLGVGLARPLVAVRRRPPGDLEREALLARYAALTARHPGIYREHAVELANLVTANGPGYLWSAADRHAYDDALGGRLVRRFRASWLGRLVLGNERLRRRLRSALGV